MVAHMNPALTRPVNPGRLANSYEDLYGQAQQKVRAKDLDGALELFQRIANRLGKMSEKAFARRPHLKQFQIMSLISIAQILSLREDYEGAVAHYENLAAAAPALTPQYQQAIAQLKIDQGQVEEGLDELRAIAVSHSGETWAWLGLGLELAGQAQYEEAETTFKRVTEREDFPAQDRSEAYQQLFDLYSEQKRYDEAEQAWLMAWRVRDSQGKDVSPLYQMFWSAGDLARASKWLEEDKNPLRYGFYRGLFALTDGNEKTARKFWQKTAAQNPLQHQGGHESWAEAALRVDLEPSQVAVVLTTLAERNMISLRGILLLAIAQIRADQAEMAQQTLEAAIDRLKFTRPRRTILDQGNWPLFCELLPDETLTENFRQYFETES